MLGIRALLLVSAMAAPTLLHAEDVAPQGDVLSEIVVTAQKREQSLKDVPIAMSVVDADTIARTRSVDLRDLSRLVPNFSVQRGGAIDTVLIRGVGGGGRNIGFTTRAGVYVDGVYAGQFASINQDTLDVERIEVLRGPQGQLFGRNTVSGAVSIVTVKPKNEFEGSVEAGYGNKDLYEIRGMLNLPLAEGVALRVSASHRERDGFTLNVPTGTDLDNVNRDSARAQLGADLGERLRFDLSADYSRDKTNKLLGEPITDTFGTGPSPLPGAFDTPFNRVPTQDAEIAGVAATFTYDLSDDVALTSISGYRRTDWKRSNDLDYVPLDFFYFNYHDRFSQFSQEVRASFGAGKRLSGVAGLYYFDETARSLRTVSGGTQSPLLPLGVVPGVNASVSATVMTRSFAGFAAVDWKATETVTVNLGGRYTHETLKLRDYTTFGPASFGLGAVANYNDGRTVDSFDPTIGVTLALSDQSNVYAKYAHGAKSGGWNIDFTSAMQFADGIDFANERVNAGEIGFKTESADRRLRFNFAGFYSVYDDYQINQFVDLGMGQTSIQLRNAAKATSWGAEASVRAVPIDGLLLTGDLGYTHAEFDRFPDGGGPGVDLDGNRLPYAPRFNAAAGAAYEFPVSAAMTVALSANYSYRSGSFAGPENTALQKVDARHLVDARIELAGDRKGWSLALWARNLFNESWIDNRIFDFFQTQAVERGEPRTYGVSTRWGF